MKDPDILPLTPDESKSLFSKNVIPEGFHVIDRSCMRLKNIIQQTVVFTKDGLEGEYFIHLLYDCKADKKNDYIEHAILIYPTHGKLRKHLEIIH